LQSNQASDIRTKLQDLVDQVAAGKALDAFDRYYADDVTMQENDQPPRVGKVACRLFEVDFLSKVTAVREYACEGFIVSGEDAYVVRRIDLDHADWGTVKMSEVAVQRWREGRIVSEKFVYG
jgi:ketosteroid isomerase-like protein